MLIRGQHRAMVTVLADRSLCHEDGIVIALSEDECGEYHVDNIELDIEHAHQSENPHPTDGHRQEREHRQLETAEGEPQKEEHDEATRPPDIVEVVGETVGQRTVHLCNIEDVRGREVGFRQCCPPLLAQRQHIDHAVVAVQTIGTDIRGKERRGERTEETDILWLETGGQQRLKRCEGISRKSCLQTFLMEQR